MKTILMIVFGLLCLQTLAIAEPSPLPSPEIAVVAAPAPTFSPTAPAGDFDPPAWLKTALMYVESVPGIGPVLVVVLQWVGVIASILTALATAFFLIVQSLTRVLRLTKLVSLAQKIDALYVKIAPILQYFSVYNVQKKTDKQG